MGQGHAGARDPLCRAGFQPRSHRRGDPSRRPPGTFGAAHEPRLVESRLHDAKGLRDLARLAGLELRALVAASSRGGTSLRRCLSITFRKRVGAGLEPSRAFGRGALDRDLLFRRPSRHDCRTEVRALRQISLGATQDQSSVAGTALGDRREREDTWQAARSACAEFYVQRRCGLVRLARKLERAFSSRARHRRPSCRRGRLQLPHDTPSAAEGGLLRRGGGPLLRDRRLGGDLSLTVRLGEVVRSPLLVRFNARCTNRAVDSIAAAMCVA
jgi:hypothetical protein